MKDKIQNIMTIVAVGIICFLSGIGFINNWLGLNKKYPRNSLFDIPFDVNIWGTVYRASKNSMKFSND